MKYPFHKTSIIVILLLFALYFAVSFYFSNEIVYFKVKSEAEATAEHVMSSPRAAGLPEPERVTIENGDVEIAGWYFSHAYNRCAVLLHHGHTSRREGMLRYTPFFRGKGCNILLIDARRHGETKYDGPATWGHYERDDTAKALDWLKEKTKLPWSRVGVMGESMGASILLQTAPLRPGLGFIIADSPFLDLATILENGATRTYGKPITILIPGAFFFAELQGNFRVEEVSPFLAAQKIHDPTLILTQESDPIIPAEHAKQVFAALPEKEKKFCNSFAAKTHTRAVTEDAENYRKCWDDFWNTYVRI